MTLTNALTYILLLSLTILCPFVTKLLVLVVNDLLAPFSLPPFKQEDGADYRRSSSTLSDLSATIIFLGTLGAVAILIGNVIELASLKTIAALYLFCTVGPAAAMACSQLVVWCGFWLVYLASSGDRSLWAGVDRLYSALKALIFRPFKK